MGLVLRMNIQCNFLGVWIDENLTGKDHTHTLENKIAKKYWTLISRKTLPWWYLPQENYFSYIHAYLNDENIARATTPKTKLKKAKRKPKRTLRIIFKQCKTSSSEPAFLSLNVLNNYQLNIF